MAHFLASGSAGVNHGEGGDGAEGLRAHLRIDTNHQVERQGKRW